MKRTTFYRAIVLVSVGFVVWTILNRFVFDPQAADFLARKTDLARPIRIPAWLRVLDVHIAFACLALLAGALNFSDRLRSRSRRLHRSIGYAYAASVLIVCVTSGYLAPYATGGRAVSMAFNLLNLIWLFVTITAIIRARRKQIQLHRQWMVRSYAFCFTNLSIHLLENALSRGFGLRYETAYAVSVYVTIALLAAIAEFINRRWFASPPAGKGDHFHA